jgi:SAM-dependent methyltransferase
VLAAQALKFFSMTSGTRRAYRKLGNVVGGRKRSAGLPSHYVKRANDNLAFLERNGLIADGMSALEIGTGWVHWEALFTRLFYDVEIVLFDVWDNRQFGGFVGHCAELRRTIASQVDRPVSQIKRAEDILDTLVTLKSFDAIYDTLAFRYVVEPSGSLASLANGSFDLIFSSDVLEHIPSQSVKTLMQDMARVLRPGGACSHQIVPADHLCIYDKTVHTKNYIRYSDRTWRRLFENDVQYFNRLQHSEWLKEFFSAGFALVGDEIVSRADLGDMQISSRFAEYDRSDLEATVTRLAMRRA